MSTHNLYKNIDCGYSLEPPQCFDQKCEKISKFLSENFQCLVVKFSVYLNRHVFIMICFVFLLTSGAVSEDLSLSQEVTKSCPLYNHSSYLHKTSYKY